MRHTVTIILDTIPEFPLGKLYFRSLARDRITLSSFREEAIRMKVEAWADSVPALA